MTENNELKGLDGWLVLLGFGVVIGALKSLLDISTYTILFEDGNWESLTTIGSEAYIPYFESLLIVEMAFNSVMITASFYLIYLFFSKHYLFPKAYIVIIVATLILIPLDAWVVTKLSPSESIFDPEITKEFMRTLIVGMIWVPYLLVSKRVRATFIEKIPNKKVPPTVESVN